MKLSIVIPVFQAAATLPRCLESIIGQSYRNWQLILVDDASTDGSRKLCDKYAAKDARIQAIHLKKNSGLSAARNAGLAKARGEYLTFVDADDFLGEDTLALLMEILGVHPDYDLLEYPIYEHYGGPGQLMLRLRRAEYTDMRAYWLRGEAYRHSYACNKVYRRELFDGVQFPVGRTFEDVATLPQVLRKCRLVATTDTGLYYYTYNPTTITRRATGKDYGWLLEAHLRAIRTLRLRATKAPVWNDYYAALVNIQLDVMERTGRKPILNPRLNLQPTRLKTRVLKLTGFGPLAQASRLFHRLHRRKD